jgi:type I restriction enzyme M protein
MMDVVRDGVFQLFSQLGQADKTKVILQGNFMKDARLEIVKPQFLTKAVEVIKNLPQAEYNGERSTNPGIA